MPRTPDETNRPFVLTALLIGLVGPGFVGCETTPDAMKKTNVRAIETGPESLDEVDPEPAYGSAEALAQQAERDMDAILKLRREALTATEEPRLGATDPRTTAQAPPKIEWNPRRNGRRTPPAAPAETAPRAETAARTDATPLARADDPPVEIQPVSPPRMRAPEGADELNMQLLRLRQKLYRASIDSRRPIRELIAIAAMAIIDPELDLPDGADRELTEDEVALLHEMHDFFARLGQSLGDADAAPGAIVGAVRELQEALAPEPRLLIPAAKLCWSVDGFGDFETFDRPVFLAHNEQQAILYLEIEGFESTQNAKQEWVTEVSQRLEIYSDRDGIPVWSETWQKAVDVTNKPRRDFFTTQVITLPKQLSVGRYHLKIQARDEASGAEAEESIVFEMVADPKLASSIPR